MTYCRKKLQIRWHLVPIELPVQSFNPRAKYEAYNLPYSEHRDLKNIMRRKKRYPNIIGGQKLENNSGVRGCAQQNLDNLRSSKKRKKRKKGEKEKVDIKKVLQNEEIKKTLIQDFKQTVTKGNAKPERKSKSLKEVLKEVSVVAKHHEHIRNEKSPEGHSSARREDFDMPRKRKTICGSESWESKFKTENNNNNPIVNRPYLSGVRRKEAAAKDYVKIIQPSVVKLSKNSGSDISLEEHFQRNLFKRKKVDASFTAITGIKVGEKSNDSDSVPIFKGAGSSSVSDPKSKFKKYLDLNVSDFIEGDEEMMEWEPIPNEMALEELKSVRSELNNGGVSPKQYFKCAMVDLTSTPSSTQVHIVLDTNILLSCLTLVKFVMGIKIFEMEPVIVIPWQVLKELDYIKGKNSTNGHITRISSSARTASNFIISHSNIIKCQSQKTSLDECPEFVVEVPDDNIIKCALQIKSKNHNVVLVSNDKNLCLKCSTTGLPAIGESSFLKIIKNADDLPSFKLSSLERPPRDKDRLHVVFRCAHHLALLFNGFLSSSIEYGLKKKYQNMWSFYLGVKRPWSLLDTIDCACLQWSVFTGVQESLYPIAILKELHTFFSNKYDTKLDSEALREALEKCYLLLGHYPPTFKPLIELFEEELKTLVNEYELNIVKPNISNEQRIQRIIPEFQKFEKLIKLFSWNLCRYLNLNCPFEEDPLDCNTSLEELLAHLPVCVQAINALIEGLNKLQFTQCGEIVPYTHGVAEVYNCLVEYLGPRHNPELEALDVVAFGNETSIRASMNDALDSFRIVLMVLQSTYNYIVTNPQLGIILSR